MPAAMSPRACHRLVSFVGKGSHHECSPGLAASCRGGRCRCRCRPPGACRVRGRQGNPRRVSAARRRPGVPACCAARWDCSARWRVPPASRRVRTSSIPTLRLFVIKSPPSLRRGPAGRRGHVILAVDAALEDFHCGRIVRRKLGQRHEFLPQFSQS